MRLCGLEGKEDLEEDRGLEKNMIQIHFLKKKLKTLNKKVVL